VVFLFFSSLQVDSENKFTAAYSSAESMNSPDYGSR